MERLDALLAATWQGAALALVVFAASRLLPRLPARFRAWLWWAVCLKMTVVAVGAFTLRLPVLPAPKLEVGMGADSLPLPSASAPSGASSLLVHSGGAANVPAASFDPITLLPVVWLAGVVLLGLVLVVQAAALAKTLRRAPRLEHGPVAEEARRLGVEIGLGQRPEVRVSSEIGAPMVICPWRPTIVLPEGFATGAGPEELRMALAHEMCHVRRGDLWLAFVPALAQALLWFNPIAWLAAREWATERETACDDAALLATGGSPVEYGRLLLKIVGDDHRGGVAHALGATAAYHTLKRRLQEMKTYVPRPTRAVRLGGASFAVAALLAALPWEVVAQTPDAPKEKNLLQNAGFEDGLNGWKRDEFHVSDHPMYAQAEVDTTVFHSGKASLKLSKTDLWYNPVLIYAQTVPITNNTGRLRIGLWAKAQDMHKATMGVDIGGSREWAAYIADASPTQGVTHDWKRYEAVVAVPQGVSEVRVSVEIYGPGTVWMDDLNASVAPADTPLRAAGLPVESTDPLADVKDVPSQELRAGNDPYKRYFLVGKPAEGTNKLLIVLPGGDGSADFNPFVRRIWKNALPTGWLVAEAVAPQWSDDQKNQVVWPTKKFRWTGMKFSTEELVDAIVKDAAAKASIDPSQVYVMGWSSGGPAAYATAMTSGSVKGALVVSSVYYPQQMPSPAGGRGRPFYLLQSPDDPVTTYGHALTAQKELTSGGAKVQLVNLSGGHGFGGDIYGSLRKGVDWLVANSK